MDSAKANTDLAAPVQIQEPPERHPGISLPKLTFVVTNYNYANYLQTCIESIAAQTYPHWECVIVDDASTDGSRELIRKLHEKFRRYDIRIILRDRNLGQLSAMLVGLAESNGAFVAFVDSDDVLSPEFAARHLATHLRTAFPVGFTSCSNADISKDGVLLTSTNVNTIPNAEILDYPISDFVRLVSQSNIEIPDLQPFPDRAYIIRDTVDIWLWAPTSGIVWRRDALAFAAPTETRGLGFYGDFYFAVLINAISSSIFFDEALVFYRRHGDNQFAGLPRLGGRAQIGIPRRNQMRLAKEIMLDHVFSHLSAFFDVIGAERFALFLQCVTKSQEFHRDQRRALQELLLPRIIANYAELERVIGGAFAFQCLVDCAGRHALQWARKIDPSIQSKRKILRRLLRWRLKSLFILKH